MPTSKYSNEENHKKILPKRGKMEVKREDFRLYQLFFKKTAFDPPQILPKVFIKEHQTDLK